MVKRKKEKLFTVQMWAEKLQHVVAKQQSFLPHDMV